MHLLWFGFYLVVDPITTSGVLSVKLFRMPSSLVTYRSILREDSSCQQYPRNMVALSPDQEFQKEVEKQDRKRHKSKWKGDAQRAASKLSSIIKKRGSKLKGGDSFSASFSTRS